ncbi:MAG: hypothetical protein JEZ07_10905 [Phycisphaerae bacterium]|nr:hypothetical protein [Phycisphaerae bacterium]
MDIRFDWLKNKFTKRVLTITILILLIMLGTPSSKRGLYCLKIVDDCYIYEKHEDQWFIGNGSMDRSFNEIIKYEVEQYNFNNQYIYGNLKRTKHYFIITYSKRSREEDIFKDKEEWIAQLTDKGIDNYHNLLDPEQEVLKYPEINVVRYKYKVMSNLWGLDDNQWFSGAISLNLLICFMIGLCLKHNNIKKYISLSLGLLTGVTICQQWGNELCADQPCGIYLFLLVFLPYISMKLSKLGGFLGDKNPKQIDIDENVIFFDELKNEVINRMETYSQFCLENQYIELDPDNLPEILRPYIPLAEIWGVSDESSRENLIEKAPANAKLHLFEIINEIKIPLDDWLNWEETNTEEVTNEYIAFRSMRMIYE